jgi:hypothetical protein
MKLSTRLFKITSKFIRMLLLLVLIRCFGADMAGYMLGALQSGRRVQAERFRQPAAK